MAKTLSPHTTLALGFLNLHAGQPTVAGGEYKFIRHQKRFTGMVGGKRDRVVVQRITYSVKQGEPTESEREAMFARAQRSVQCFIDRADGTVLYAGGWDSPAKWKTGLATEFGPGESETYAKAVSQGLWGYQGDRKVWEEKQASA